jgi:recombination protein RecR
LAYPPPLEQLVQAFERFPGVGRRTAERLAFHLLRDPKAREFAQSVLTALRDTAVCRQCFNAADSDPCRICSDPERDGSLLLVVEQPRDVEAIERAGIFRGRYHVLMGAFNPGEGSEASHLTLAGLERRVREGEVREVILATDPDAEGEATAALVAQALDRLRRSNLRISRLARGLPAGSAIEYLHRGVLEDALVGRRPLRPLNPES